MKRAMIVLAAMVTFMVYVASCSGGDSPVVTTPPPPPPPPPPCDITLSWTLPTEREPNEDGVSVPLDPTELDFATLTLGMIPMAPEEEIVYTNDIDAHALQWQILDNPAGTYYFRLTVTDTEGLESEYSNEASKTCPVVL